MSASAGSHDARRRAFERRSVGRQSTAGVLRAASIFSPRSPLVLSVVENCSANVRRGDARGDAPAPRKRGTWEWSTSALSWTTDLCGASSKLFNGAIESRCPARQVFRESLGRVRGASIVGARCRTTYGDDEPGYGKPRSCDSNEKHRARNQALLG